MMQQYKQQNSRVGLHNTVYAYMDTKGRMCCHLHSTNETKMYIINTMSVPSCYTWPARRYSLCCPAWQLVCLCMHCIDLFSCKAACVFQSNQIKSGLFQATWPIKVIN